MQEILKRLGAFLGSRKTMTLIVALTFGVIMTGFQDHITDDGQVLMLVAGAILLGVSNIMGISLEDYGAKRGINFRDGINRRELEIIVRDLIEETIEIVIVDDDVTVQAVQGVEQRE